MFSVYIACIFLFWAVTEAKPLTKRDLHESTDDKLIQDLLHYYDLRNNTKLQLLANTLLRKQSKWPSNVPHTVDGDSLENFKDNVGSKTESETEAIEDRGKKNKEETRYNGHTGNKKDSSSGKIDRSHFLKTNRKDALVNGGQSQLGATSDEGSDGPFHSSEGQEHTDEESDQDLGDDLSNNSHLINTGGADIISHDSEQYGNQETEDSTDKKQKIKYLTTSAPEVRSTPSKPYIPTSNLPHDGVISDSQLQFFLSTVSSEIGVAESVATQQYSTVNIGEHHRDGAMDVIDDDYGVHPEENEKTSSSDGDFQENHSHYKNDGKVISDNNRNVTITDQSISRSEEEKINENETEGRMDDKEVGIKGDSDETEEIYHDASENPEQEVTVMPISNQQINSADADQRQSTQKNTQQTLPRATDDPDAYKQGRSGEGSIDELSETIDESKDSPVEVEENDKQNSKEAGQDEDLDKTDRQEGFEENSDLDHEIAGTTDVEESKKEATEESTSNNVPDTSEALYPNHSFDDKETDENKKGLAKEHFPSDNDTHIHQVSPAPQEHQNSNIIDEMVDVDDGHVFTPPPVTVEASQSSSDLSIVSISNSPPVTTAILQTSFITQFTSVTKGEQIQKEIFTTQTVKLPSSRKTRTHETTPASITNTGMSFGKTSTPNRPIITGTTQDPAVEHLDEPKQGGDASIENIDRMVDKPSTHKYKGLPCHGSSYLYSSGEMVASAVGGVIVGAAFMFLMMYMKQRCNRYLYGDYRPVPREYDFELSPRVKTH